MSEELLFGINPVREALRGTRTAHELFIQTTANDHRLAKIITLAEKSGIPVRRREREDLTRLCNSSHHQGVALRVSPFQYSEMEDLVEKAEKSGPASFIIVLDGIQDPHNLGALIRTAACAGVAGVIIPKDRACGITPAVEKTSAGAVETVPVARVTNIVQTLDALKQQGYWIHGLADEGGHALHDTKFSDKIVLVVGGEGEGIRPLVRKHCDLILTIPHHGGVSSLNASVAGGIAMFEVARQLYGALGK